MTVILLGNGGGTFGKPHGFNAGFGVISVAVGDFNNDGNEDLAVADLSGSVNILLGNGDGTFGKPQKRNVGASLTTGSIVIADFNLDGKLDVAVGGMGADAFLLFGNGDGTLKPAIQVGSTRTTGGPQLGWLAMGDFNGDGKPDLASISDGGVTILLNTSNEHFQIDKHGTQLPGRCKVLRTLCRQNERPGKVPLVL